VKPFHTDKDQNTIFATKPWIKNAKSVEKKWRVGQTNCTARPAAKTSIIPSCAQLHAMPLRK